MENGTGDTLRGGLADLRRLLVGPDFPPAPPAGPPRWWRRGQAFLVPPLLLALVGLAVASAQYLSDARGRLPEQAAILLGIGSTLPAALAPLRPLLAWRVGYPMLYLGVSYAEPDEPWPWNPVQICAFLFLLILLAGRATTGIAAWAGVLSLVPVYLFVDERANAHGVAVLLVVILVLGDQVRRRRQSQHALAEQAEVSELERARRAVLEERARIAREMHDVVAHHMSMIAVQAETAAYRLTGLPEAARAEFSAIADSARVALTDMRRLLGVLRSEPAAPETAPQPGLADVPELVEAARRAGMAVSLTDTPAPAGAESPPEPVGLAAYRIVQEALANAARHAPGAVVEVTIDRHRRGMAIDVRNGPATAKGEPKRPAPADRSAPVRDGGHGLTGMRERARLLGGTFSAGPTDDGYAVTAYLPYRAEEIDVPARVDAE